MARHIFPVPLASLALLAALAVAAPAKALDVRCALGQVVRDIEVRFAQDADGLPCQVIWQTAVDAEQGELVWRSASRREFCTDKARALAHQLIEGGWRCQSADAAYASRLVPEETAPSEPNEPEPDAALPLAPEEGPRAPSEQDAAEQAPRPDQALLRAALARDVRRLDELTGSSPGDFEAQMSRLGDLDGDGLEDAVALLAFRQKGAAPSRHVLAYRFDGETFQPVARLPLAGAAHAEIGAVANGVVEVVVHVARSGDPACCPSGRRHVRFALRDHELVRLPADRPGTWDGGRGPTAAP